MFRNQYSIVRTVRNGTIVFQPSALSPVHSSAVVKADAEVAEENALLRNHLAMKNKRYRAHEFVERR